MSALLQQNRTRHRLPVALLTIALAWALPNPSAAQTISNVDEPYPRRYVDAEHGFFGYDTRAILQDSQGEMWLGTEAGLYVHDGFETREVRSLDTEIASNQSVRALIQDRSGIIWIGGLGGIARLEEPRGVPEQFLAVSDLGGQVSTLVECQDALWVGFRDTGRFNDPALVVGQGISRVDRASRIVLPKHPELEGQAVFDLKCVAKGILVASGRRDRSGRPVRSQVSLVAHPDDAPQTMAEFQGTLVFDMEPDGTDALWLATSRGVERLDLDSGAIRSIQTTDGSLDYGHLTRASDSSVWWTSPDGLFRADAGSELFRPIPSARGESDQGPVRSLAADRSGGVWSGHASNGVIRTSRPPVVVHQRRLLNEDGTAIPNPFVTVYNESEEGVAYVGTLNQGFAELTPGRDRPTWYRHDPLEASSLRSNNVQDILLDSRGRLWVATSGGVDWMPLDQPGVFRHLDRPSETETGRSQEVRSLFEDSEGHIWISYTWYGVVRLHPGLEEYELFPFPEGVPGPIAVFVEEPTGAIWGGGYGTGLGRLENGTSTVYRSVSGDSTTLSNPSVVGIVPEDEKFDRLWIATAWGGLNLIDRDRGRIGLYATASGTFPDDRITGLQRANDGSLWTKTLSGVVRFDPILETWYRIRESDGLMDTWGWALNHGTTREGHLVFGQAGGYLVIEPESFIGVDTAPLVRLTDVLVGGVPSTAEFAREMRLAHDQSDLTFRYTGVHQHDPSRVRYRTRLSADEEWTYPGTARSAAYRSLGAGSYTFEVQAAGASATWSSAARLPFVIRAVWWRTPWGVGLLTLVVIGAALGVGRWQRKRIRRVEQERARLLEADLRARAAEEQAGALRQLDEAKSRFFSNIAHEFRTPLTLIMGPLEDAVRADPHEVSVEQIPSMRRNVERLHRLINQLLELARLESGETSLNAEPLDLSASIRLWAGLFDSRARKKAVELRVDVPGETSMIKGDAERLESAVVNLLDNAIKFTPEGGSVLVALQQDSGRCTISVSDTGMGIPEEDLPHVFERFYRVDESKRQRVAGTGIGLALVREVARLHGGFAGVERLNPGTRFTISFPSAPVAGSPQSRAQAVPVSEPSPDEAPHTEESNIDAPVVLIVEDNRDMRAYLRSCLEGDYRVREAENGRQGLEALRQDPPDLLISDVMMPDMNGLDLARAVREDEQLRHLPVILLTALDQDSSRLEGLKTGADDYLTKPFKREELLLRAEHLVRVRSLLRQRFEGQVRIGASDRRVDSADARWLEKVRELVESKLSDLLLSVDGLADDMALSPRQFRRRLKSLTGLSPTGYVRMIRLERAQQLLAQDWGGVQEVARAVGYEDPRHFSKLFRQAVGVPPSEFSGL